MIRPWGTVIRRSAGVVLVAAAIAPWWHWVAPAPSDLLADAVRRGDRILIATWLQTGILVLVGAALAALLRGRLEAIISTAGVMIRRPATRAYATAVGLVGTAYASAISWFVWEGRPPLTDAWAVLIQARYLAAGHLAAPADLPNAFFIVANTFVTDVGWTAQYPPGHSMLLALGLIAGIPWLVGPLLAGATAAMVVLLGERLVPENPLVGRLAGLVAAASPLLALPSAAYMSHAPAALLTVLAAYAGARARAGRIEWMVLAGLSIGVAFAVRPLTGITLGLVAGLGSWWAAPGITIDRRGAVRHWGAAILCALIPAASVAWYNATLFGSPFEFGYTAYLGPGHAPGFHANPWGQPYGLAEAIAFTTTDLVSLGVSVLRMPLSAIFVLGVFLSITPRLTPAARLVAIWGGFAVANAAAYWHHDLLLGPRMLADATPAWCLALAMAGLGIVRVLPDNPGRAVSGRHRAVSGRRLAIAMLTSAAVYGVGIGTFQTVRELQRAFPPPPSAPESPGPTVVFVHDSWSGRLAARLGAAGMRGDSIALLLRTTEPCAIQGLLDGHLDRSALEDASREPRGWPDTLASQCVREREADRFGGLPLMPLIWQGDLPGLDVRTAMFVRDLGPGLNAALLTRYPERQPAMLVQRPPGPRPLIVPYETGINLLWSPADSALEDSATVR